MRRMRWFGPSREEMWRRLSDEIGARYVDGGFWKGDRVEVTHDNWTLTLDTYTVSTGKVTVVYTRMRAPFINPSAFRFTIYRKGFFTGLAKYLGMQDIEIGDPVFDDAFVIKATDENRVRDLFSDPQVRRLAAMQPEIHLQVRDDEGMFGTKFPERADELLFYATGVITDIERLKNLYDLFSTVLETLTRIGVAADEPPGVKV